MAPHGAQTTRSCSGQGIGGVYRVAAAGGTPQAVTELDASRAGGVTPLAAVPAGWQALSFHRARSGLADQRGVYVGSLDGKTRHLLIRSDGNAQYVAPGYLLFLDEDTLLGQSFDRERLALAGQPMPIAARVGRSSRGDGAFSSSSKGTLAYAGATPADGTPDLVRPQRERRWVRLARTAITTTRTSGSRPTKRAWRRRWSIRRWPFPISG